MIQWIFGYFGIHVAPILILICLSIAGSRRASENDSLISFGILHLFWKTGGLTTSAEQYGVYLLSFLWRFITPFNISNTWVNWAVFAQASSVNWHMGTCLVSSFSISSAFRGCCCLSANAAKNVWLFRNMRKLRSLHILCHKTEAFSKASAVFLNWNRLNNCSVEYVGKIFNQPVYNMLLLW